MENEPRAETAAPEQASLVTVEPQVARPVGPPRAASPTKVFRPWSPEQAALLPASKRDYLGEDHLAVFLLELLPTLELRPILDAYAEDRGQPPYEPRMMMVLLRYAYSQGLTSSRQIERRCREDLAFMYLTGDAHPDHDTICAFRRQHLGAFTALFLETLRIAQAAGVLKLGRIALDGTKVRANASKHKAMSYARMPERQAALQAEVRRLLEEAEALDQAEDAQYGRDRRATNCRRSCATPRRDGSGCARPKRAWRRRASESWRRRSKRTSSRLSEQSRPSKPTHGSRPAPRARPTRRPRGRPRRPSATSPIRSRGS